MENLEISSLFSNSVRTLDDGCGKSEKEKFPPNDSVVFGIRVDVDVIADAAECNSSVSLCCYYYIIIDDVVVDITVSYMNNIIVVASQERTNSSTFKNTEQ